MRTSRCGASPRSRILGVGNVPKQPGDIIRCSEVACHHGTTVDAVVPTRRSLRRAARRWTAEGELLPMKCPNCQVDNDRVIDTRAQRGPDDDPSARECLKCGRRYTTYERYEPTILKVVKKDGVREPFEHDKIRRGLEKACWKRPISHAQIETVVNTVEPEVTERFEAEVDSHSLGQIVMAQLRKLDQVAYVRFASVYRQFKDIRDFVDELQPILQEQNADFAARAARMQLRAATTDRAGRRGRESFSVNDLPHGSGP